MEDQELLSKAREFFLNLPSVEVAKTVVILSFCGVNVKFEPHRDFDGFQASRYANVTLEASVDGELASPLDDHIFRVVQARLVKEGRENKSLLRALENSNARSFACRSQGSLFPLNILYHAPEALLEADGSHGTAEIVALPQFFPFSADTTSELTSLKFFLHAQNEYYADARDGELRMKHLLEAEKLILEARKLDPNNCLIGNRLAAILIKLGKKKECIKILTEHHKATPHVAKIFWRVGWMLFNDQKPHNALITLYGGASKHKICRTKLGSRIVTLSRRCLLEIYGRAAFGNSLATWIGAGVLQLIANHLRVWDVLRLSEVCFSWWHFLSAEAYWKARAKRDFGITVSPSQYLGSKAQYRKLLAEAATSRVEVVGLALFETSAGTGQNTPKFLRWDPPYRDYNVCIWRAFLKYLRSLGYGPEDYVFMMPHSKLSLKQGHVGEKMVSAYHEVWTLPSVALTNSIPGAVVLVPCVNLQIPFCNSCFHYTRNLNVKSTCKRIHSLGAVGVDVGMSRLRDDPDCYSRVVKQQITRRYNDFIDTEKYKFAEAKGRWYDIRWPAVYTCCGSVYSHEHCANANHSQGRAPDWMHIKTIHTGVGIAFVPKDPLAQHQLSREKLFEEDPFLHTYEQKIVKSLQTERKTVDALVFDPYTYAPKENLPNDFAILSLNRKKYKY